MTCKFSYWRQESPLGPLFVYKTSKGVCAIDFLPLTPTLSPKGRGRRPALSGVEGVRGSQMKKDLRIAKQLNQYFQGKRKIFSVPIDLYGVSGFSKKVLQTLTHEVGFGQKISYGELASRVGQPQAVRAVGQAMRKNPIPIVIPCHRVVASDGSLGGYSAGLHRKKRLLMIEKTTV
ncbi:MAG: methylated-DNA--[protein]-cysteine S-methyltransferase [Deltaproteobacteria bacterium]|nr:methylated-DNA--[protein]-cysteine S-methyltransferase [Deltaproteobacteria bacterium]